jgi:hypothetical protein
MVVWLPREANGTTAAVNNLARQRDASRWLETVRNFLDRVSSEDTGRGLPHVFFLPGTLC